MLIVVLLLSVCGVCKFHFVKWLFFFKPKLVRHPGNDAHQMVLTPITKWNVTFYRETWLESAFVQLSFTDVWQRANMNYGVEPSLNERKKREMSLLKGKFSCWGKVEHSSGGHTLESLLNGSQPPHPPGVVSEKDFSGKSSQEIPTRHRVINQRSFILLKHLKVKVTTKAKESLLIKIRKTGKSFNLSTRLSQKTSIFIAAKP